MTSRGDKIQTTIIWQSFCGLLIVTELSYDENEYAQLTVKVFYSVHIKLNYPLMTPIMADWMFAGWSVIMTILHPSSERYYHHFALLFLSIGPPFCKQSRSSSCLQQTELGLILVPDSWAITSLSTQHYLRLIFQGICNQCYLFHSISHETKDDLRNRNTHIHNLVDWTINFILSSQS